MTTDLPNSLVGWTDPTMSVQHIWILKNGSSFIRHHAEQLNWQLKAMPIDHKVARFAILRDPYQRWLTGFTEDIKLYINSKDDDNHKEYLTKLFSENINWFLEFLIDRDIMFFDTHAHLQVKLLEIPLQTLGKENITFFKMNELLGYSLNHWLHGEGVPNKFNNEKIYSRDKNDSIFRNISTFFMDAKNIKRKGKVLDYLQPDYELLNSVRFFNDN
jgi:hypothetical protein